jgi:serine/threonine-protein kinase mTOR
MSDWTPEEAATSPINAINQEVRRRNVAAAASFHSIDASWSSDDDADARTSSAAAAAFSYKEDPRHAEALLQATPQLRFLSPASTDLNGAGRVPHPVWSWVVREGGANATNVGTASINTDYSRTLRRDRANQRAAAELAALLSVLAHEMPLEDYGVVESQVFTAVFALLHAPDKESRMAGLAALYALLSVPSADEERKAIKFANSLSNGLRSAQGDFEFLSAVCTALGHMAPRNVDLVEAEITRALEWLRTERSDRRLAAGLALMEFATHLPTTFHSKTSQATLGQGGSNEFLDHIFQAIWDPQPIVRACAADALVQCLKILVERQHPSLTGLLCQVYFNLVEGLQEEPPKKRSWHALAAADAARHGSLLVVATMLATTRDFMIPRLEEVCRAVLRCTRSPYALVRLEVVRLIPRLAHRGPSVFGRRYLEESLLFLMHSAATPPGPRVGIDLRPSAFTALGQLMLAMKEDGHVIGGSHLPTIHIRQDENGQIVELSKTGIIYRMLPDIFALMHKGLRPPSVRETSTVCPALHCAASLVEALGDLALPYIPSLIDEMFQAGLSNDLIQCLQSISACVPAQQNDIEDRMLQGVSVCLAGQRYDPLASFKFTGQEHLTHSLPQSNVRRQESRPLKDDYMYDPMSGGIHSFPDAGTERSGIQINMASDVATVKSLVLGLETLSSVGGTMGIAMTSGGMVPLKPFVKGVAACYLVHPSFEVRKAAALTCCTLLIPIATARNTPIGGYSGILVEHVLQKLLRTAVSDPSAAVRLCVVQALDARYDSYLCQSHHLRELFLLLQDEALATKAAGLRLLGRLASINPGPILPILRRLLNDLIVELQCGASSGRAREEATRLLVVYLRASPLQRLVHPVIHTLVNALPLDKTAPPRLVSVSLEALGELAHASGNALQPWVPELMPHVLEILEDRSSASKQRTSLRTLGQIAGSTGYVIRPYLDYPNLLTQATEILPATKRAPWSLRREVIRTLGILGALDPDRYHEIASKTSKGGAIGGAYFEVDMNDALHGDSAIPLEPKISSQANQMPKIYGNLESSALLDRDDDDNEPASRFMYEQYAMVAQPAVSLPPANRMTPWDDGFYPTVSIQALMRIFRDQSLAVHHSMVVQAVMFIFKSLGMRCVPFLNKVVPHMIHAVRTSAPSNLRESLLMQLAALSGIVREHLRPFVSDVFEIVEQFWVSRHLSTILMLVSNLAIGSPDEFRLFVPKLIKLLLSTFDELQIADWSSGPPHDAVGLTKGRAESQKLGLVVKSIVNLRVVLGDFLRIIVPALLKLANSFASLSFLHVTERPDVSLDDLSILVYKTIAALLDSPGLMPTPQISLYSVEGKVAARQTSENGLAACVVQPLVRTLLEKPPNSPAVGFAIVDTLCVCGVQVGSLLWFQLYDGVVKDAIIKWQTTFPAPAANDLPMTSRRVDGRVVSCVEYYSERLYQQPTAGHSWITGSDFLQLGSFESSADLFDLASPQSISQANRLKVDQTKLQRAWDASQRSSKDDWEEWMRRLGIQLLREAPSPALRACSSLAHAYQPLARELFSAAFACCWKELSAPYRADLIRALKTAFVADFSPEILQALLNLAEFMEHDPSNGLPIEIPVLAELALKCRAFAKALHYTERQYNIDRTPACVESLISINGKLDLPGTLFATVFVFCCGMTLSL